MAALHAYWRDPNQKILLVCKGMLGKSGCTRMVQGGYNVVLDPRDSISNHFADTIKGGGFINDQELAWTLVEDAPRVVRELENKIGCLFDRAPDGKIHQKPFAGQSFDRTVHVGDLTGIEIMSRLRDQVMAFGIPCLQNTRGLELLTFADGKQVIGAVLLDVVRGSYTVVKSKAVILCTGAGPLMYQRAACAQEKSSDGPAMAFRVGAHLMDMEMVQFHPTGLVVPGSRLNGALLEEGLRGAGAQLFNGQGERFMERYDPEKKERSTRDKVARSAYLEIMSGRGTENGAVWLDISHRGAEFVEQNFVGMRERCLRIGVDIARERIEIAPTAHFNMGGVRIDKNGFTNLIGLFAAGEDSSGVHGANRLGGNGVAESTVYGARVGDFVAGWVRDKDGAEPEHEQIERAKAEAEKFLERQDGETAWPLREELGKITWEKVGIVRHGDKLKKAIEEIGQLKQRLEQVSAPGGRVFNLTWHQALDMRNMLCASELTARSALTREDSRGAHFREDFEKTDNTNWLKNVYVSREGAGVKLWTEPVKLSRLRPS